MVADITKRVIVTLTLASLVFVSGAGADDIKLPDMGSPADAILNTSDEAQIGRMIAALEAGDADEAEAAMSDHLEASRRRALGLI